MKCPNCGHDMTESRAGWLCGSCGHIEVNATELPDMPGNSSTDTQVSPDAQAEAPEPPPPSTKAPWEVEEADTQNIAGPVPAQETAPAESAATANHFEAVEQPSNFQVAADGIKDTDLLAVDQALAAVPDKLLPPETADPAADVQREAASSSVAGALPAVPSVPSIPIVTEMAAIPAEKAPAETMENATDDPKLEHHSAKPVEVEDEPKPKPHKAHHAIHNHEPAVHAHSHAKAKDEASDVANASESKPAEVRSPGLDAHDLHQTSQPAPRPTDSFEGPTPAAALAGKSHIILDPPPAPDASADDTPSQPPTEPDTDQSVKPATEVADPPEPEQQPAIEPLLKDEPTAEPAPEPAPASPSGPDSMPPAEPAPEPAPVPEPEPEPEPVPIPEPEPTPESEITPELPEETSSEPEVNEEAGLQVATGLGQTAEPAPEPESSPEAQAAPDPEPASPSGPDSMPPAEPAPEPAPVPEPEPELDPAPVPEPEPITPAAAVAPPPPAAAEKAPLMPVTHPKPLNRKVLITSVMAGVIMIALAAAAYYALASPSPLGPLGLTATSPAPSASMTPAPSPSVTPSVSPVVSPTPATSAALRDAKRKTDLVAYIQAYRATVNAGYYATLPPSTSLTLSDPSTNQAYQISASASTALGTISYLAGHQCSGKDYTPGKTSTKYVALTIKLETDTTPYCLNVNN